MNKQAGPTYFTSCFSDRLAKEKSGSLQSHLQYSSFYIFAFVQQRVFVNIDDGLFFRSAKQLKVCRTSTGLYRSCAALASFSGTFDLILFEAVYFDFIADKVWF